MGKGAIVSKGAPSCLFIVSADLSLVLSIVFYIFLLNLLDSLLNFASLLSSLNSWGIRHASSILCWKSNLNESRLITIDVLTVSGIHRWINVRLKALVIPNTHHLGLEGLD